MVAATCSVDVNRSVSISCDRCRGEEAQRRARTAGRPPAQAALPCRRRPGARPWFSSMMSGSAPRFTTDAQNQDVFPRTPRALATSGRTRDRSNRSGAFPAHLVGVCVRFVHLTGYLSHFVTFLRCAVAARGGEQSVHCDFASSSGGRIASNTRPRLPHAIGSWCTGVARVASNSSAPRRGGRPRRLPVTGGLPATGRSSGSRSAIAATAAARAGCDSL